MNNTFNNCTMKRTTIISRDPAGPTYDFDRLADELAELRLRMCQRVVDPAQLKALDAVNKAEEAARGKDQRTALDQLRKAGQWALDIATKIGVQVATDALKKALSA